MQYVRFSDGHAYCMMISHDFHECLMKIPSFQRVVSIPYRNLMDDREIQNTPDHAPHTLHRIQTGRVDRLMHMLNVSSFKENTYQSRKVRTNL